MTPHRPHWGTTQASLGYHTGCRPHWVTTQASLGYHIRLHKGPDLRCVGLRHNLTHAVEVVQVRGRECVAGSQQLGLVLLRVGFPTGEPGVILAVEVQGGGDLGMLVGLQAITSWEGDAVAAVRGGMMFPGMHACICRVEG